MIEESKELALKLDIGDNITSLIEKLASQIGTTADKVFPWYVKQQVIDGWMFLACGFAAALIGLVMVLLSRKHADFGRGNTAAVGVCAGWVVLFVGGMFLLCGSPTAVTQIFNPEYHALKSLTADMASLIRK